ncbi:MAG: hypothetical protein K0R38_7152 [Polyangiaceae bacterium]|jgi:hypothetical protein|nr:hypothetical protein [Polyangiaceae bacterium]
MRWRSPKAWCLVAALGSLDVGCTRPGAQPIVGPDGSPMAHVHCGSDQGACFRLAGEVCPGGYDLQPALTGHDGNFLVRCRAPQPQVAVAAPCASPSSTPHVAAKPGETWPPSNEPWPATYPWPPPETSAAARPPPSPGTAKPPLEIDLGY